MYRAVITDRGKAWLEGGGNAPTRHVLATLVSPQLEAAHPRALFDAFCARLSERLGALQSSDECRILWRKLCGDGAIALRQGFESYREVLLGWEEFVPIARGWRRGSRQWVPLATQPGVAG
jgi:hypothetical protein